MSGLSTNTNTSSEGAREVQHHHSHDLGHKSGTKDMFSGMKEYKRDSENAAGQQRREDMKDMSANSSGVLGKMWDNTFRGPSEKS